MLFIIVQLELLTATLACLTDRGLCAPNDLRTPSAPVH